MDVNVKSVILITPDVPTTATVWSFVVPSDETSTSCPELCRSIPIDQRTLAAAVSLAWRAHVPIAADPTSVSLAPVLIPHLNKIWLITLNESEAEVLSPHSVPHADRNRAIEAARYLVSQDVEIAIITMAEFGLGYASVDSNGHVPALQTEIIDPTGAGDALTSAVIFALLNDIPLDEAVRLGLSAAALTLRSPGTVAPDLSLELLYAGLR